MKARLLMAVVALIAVSSIGAELPPIYTTGDATVCFATGNKVDDRRRLRRAAGRENARLGKIVCLYEQASYRQTELAR